MLYIEADPEGENDSVCAIIGFLTLL